MTRSTILSLAVLAFSFSLALYGTRAALALSPLVPGDNDTAFVRADSLLRRGQIDSAKALYSTIAGRDGNSIRAMNGLGRVALAGGDWGEALDIARRIGRLDTANAASHYLAAIAYREIGINQFRHSDWETSRRQFEWIVRHDSSYDDALYQYAVLERYDGNLERALELARAEVTLRPELESPKLGLYKLYRYFLVEDNAADFLRALIRQPGSIPRYFAGEVFRRNGNLDTAEAVFDALLSHPGDVCPQAIYLSRARLRFKRGDRLGAEGDYWKAVEELRTPLGARILFEDLKYIVSDGELEYYAGLRSVSEQMEFFRSFWNFRNPSLALKVNLRLQEHIRRSIVVEERYEYYGFRTRFNNPDNLHELNFPRAFALNEEINDMGLIFMRQGEPDDVLRKSASPYDEQEMSEQTPGFDKSLSDEIADRYRHAQNDPYESWLYNATPESPKMIFHFQKHNSAGNNWRLTPGSSYDLLVSELRQWDTKYQRLFRGREIDRAIVETQIKADSRTFVGYGLTTEKHTWEKNTRTFRFPHSIDVFRGTGGGSLLDISYAIPIAPLVQSLPDSVHILPVEIGFSMIDSHSRHSLLQLDTIRIGLSHTRTGVIIDLIRYTVPPDSYAISMHIRPLSVAVLGTWRQALQVNDFSGSGLMLSSIQILRPSLEKGALEIQGVKVIQSPYRTHILSDPLYVYFQVYHLVPDVSGTTSYATECVLLPRDEDDPARGEVIHRMQKTGTEEMAAEFYRLDVHAVVPGQYKLLVRVTDNRRVQTLVGERELDIVKP